MPISIIENASFGNSGIVTANGIKFPATQVASADANTLDDYEEGSWSPTIVGSSTAGTGTYTIQFGSYIKVGKLVFVNIRLGWSAHTGTGTMSITNLPFTSATTAYSGLTVCYNDGLTLPASSIFNSQVTPSSTTILLSSLAVAGTTTGLAMDTSVPDMAFSGCYQASN